MNESNLIKTVDFLLLLASACLFYGLLYYFTEEHVQATKGITGKAEVVQIPEPKDEPKNISNLFELRTEIDSLGIHYETLETEYVGVCFITAYCPQELGFIEYSDGTDNFPKGWLTASGEICHYSEDPFEPTTCAIDRNYFGFYELLMIDGKVYRTEDTGAFRGLWVDVFRPDYESMTEHGSHYSEVYSIYYEEHFLSAKERKKQNEWFNDYLHYWRVGDRVPCRNYCRTDD